uniref:Uncharacterized protein n=1 Tax=Arundo donax TaxID=35708 RepID=A0A0A9A686_ARUDO
MLNSVSVQFTLNITATGAHLVYMAL